MRRFDERLADCPTLPQTPDRVAGDNGSGSGDVGNMLENRCGFRRRPEDRRSYRPGCRRTSPGRGPGIAGDSREQDRRGRSPVRSWGVRMARRQRTQQRGDQGGPEHARHDPRNHGASASASGTVVRRRRIVSGRSVSAELRQDHPATALQIRRGVPRTRHLTNIGVVNKLQADSLPADNDARPNRDSLV